MQKRYWLKIGLIFMILYIVIGIISYGLFVNCSSDSIGLSGLGCLKYLIPLLIATGPIFEKINEFLPNSVIFLINGITWFFIGSFFGWLYGKIKNRNKV